MNKTERELATLTLLVKVADLLLAMNSQLNPHSYGTDKSLMDYRDFVVAKMNQPRRKNAPPSEKQ